DDAVITGGGQPPAIRGLEPRLVNVGGVAAEYMDCLAAVGVPDADGPIVARRDQALAVGAKLEARDQGRVALKGEEFAAARHVPDLDGTRSPPRVASGQDGRGQTAPARAEREAEDPAGRRGEGADHRTGRRIPGSHDTSRTAQLIAARGE